MANWPVLRAAWVDLTELAALELQKIDTFLTKVPNFMDGSSHNSAAQVQLGGAGLKLNGATALEINGTATWDALAHAVFLSSSSLRMQAGSTFITDVGSSGLISGSWEHTAGTSLWDNGTSSTWNGSVTFNSSATFGNVGIAFFNGIVEFTASSDVNFLSGCVAEFNPGSHLNFDGGSFISVAASTTFDLFSTMTVRSGGSIDVRSGAQITVEGTIALSGSAAITVGSGTEIDVQNGAVMVFSSGSSMNGTKDDNTTTTRTSPTIQSGDNAMIDWRVLSFDGLSGRPDGDQNATFHVWKHDYIAATTLSANRTWTLDAPPSNREVRTRFLNRSGTFTLGLKDSVTLTTVVVPAGGSAEMVYSNGSNGLAQGWTLAS